ncbi:MAG: elongation factor G [Dehalococcoidia bacterium]|nr:elongation factor G [Dehalococcoidia bacterium]
MRTIDAAHIRNVAFLGHGGAGKTSLSEAILFSTGAISRQGKVTEGNTTSDFEAEETKRHISINLSLLPCEWKGHKLNVVDTPGYADFVGEVVAALGAVDSAIIAVDASAGVEVGTEQAWQHADKQSLPRLVLVNKMDRENADFFRTLDQVQSVFGKKCVPLQIPIGSQSDFSGVVDLVKMKAYTGAAAEEKDIPANLADQAKNAREKLVEAVAELNDELIGKYLEGKELTQEEIATGVHDGTKAGKLVPVLAASGLQSKGIARLLDAIVELLPSPKERQPIKAKSPTGEANVIADPAGPLAALVFKTAADPYVGKLTYFRVWSGTFHSNSHVWNATKGSDERVGQLFMVRGKAQEPVPQVEAGDIGAVSKLATTGTGDTLTLKDKPMVLPAIEFPQPSLTMAVRPKTKGDLDKMSQALPRLVEEDPTLKLRRDPDTAETILAGLGENHLEVAAEKLQRKFGAGVVLEQPKVAYRETVGVTTESEYKHKKQTGGHGQYGHVLLRLEPLKRGEGFKFESAVVGGSVPRNFIPAVEKGVNEARHEGVIAGYPLVDLKVVLFDGSYHDVDSSEMAFKIASSQALKKGLAEAHPVLLEPVVNLRIVVPEDFTGHVISDLNTKRARVQGMNRDATMTIIEAQAPHAEMVRYAVDLRSITQGRGTFTTEFSHYEEVPAFMTPKIAEERLAQKQAEKEEM